MLAFGGQKPRIVAIQAKVDVHAFRAFEPRTNDVQLATTRKSGKKCQATWDKYELGALVSDVLQSCAETESERKSCRGRINSLT